MKLIIGLGNPGPKYINTRHNLGFEILEELKNQLGSPRFADEAGSPRFARVEAGGFPDWREDKSFQALISDGQIKNEKIILAKPQTFMNLSGQAVKLLSDFYKTPAENIWVVHDDLDLPLGAIRVSQNAGPGGHKGIKSIIESLGYKNFIRFRAGIHPIGQTFFTCFFKRLTSTEKFVLQKFSKLETEKIEQVKQKTAQAIIAATKDGLASTMNQFN